MNLQGKATNSWRKNGRKNGERIVEIEVVVFLKKGMKNHSLVKDPAREGRSPRLRLGEER